MTITASRTCAGCGREIGDNYTGRDQDRMSDPGRVWCEDCISTEAETRRSQTTTRDGENAAGGTPDYDATNRQSTT